MESSHISEDFKVLPSLSLYLLFLDEYIAPAGEEEGELGEYRYKLQRFLQISTAYSPEKLLVQLRHNCKT